MTANLTHAIMCVLLPKRTWNPEVQSATIRLLVTHGTRWQASLCPPTAPETVEDPCGCSWREQTKWEAGVQDSGFRHIPAMLTDGMFLARVQGSWSPSELSLTRWYVNIPDIQGHRPHSWIILLEAASVPVFWMNAHKGIFPQPRRLFSTLSHNYCGLYQHRKYVL